MTSIRHLRAAARAAVRPWVRTARVVNVNGGNDYDVQIPGSVDAYGVEVPMRHVRSLAANYYAVGEEVYVGHLNHNRPREGALWVILDSAAALSRTKPALEDAWSLWTCTAQRQRGRNDSLPLSWALDGTWEPTGYVSSYCTHLTPQLYVATVTDTPSDSLKAFSLVDGSEAWSTTVGGLSSSSAIYNGVWYGTAGGSLRAVDVADGTVLWTKGNVTTASALCFIEDTGFYLTGTRYIKAFDIATGDVLWTFDVRNAVADSSIIIGNGQEVNGALMVQNNVLMVGFTVTTEVSLKVRQLCGVIGIDPTAGTASWTTYINRSGKGGRVNNQWTSLNGNAVLAVQALNDGSPIVDAYATDLVFVTSTGVLKFRTAMPSETAANCRLAACKASGYGLLVESPLPGFDVCMVAFGTDGQILWQRTDEQVDRPLYHNVVAVGDRMLCVYQDPAHLDKMQIDEFSAYTSSCVQSHVVQLDSDARDVTGVEVMAYDGKLYVADQTGPRRIV